MARLPPVRFHAGRAAVSVAERKPLEPVDLRPDGAGPETAAGGRRSVPEGARRLDGRAEIAQSGRSDAARAAARGRRDLLSARAGRLFAAALRYRDHPFRRLAEGIAAELLRHFPARPVEGSAEALRAGARRLCA